MEVKVPGEFQSSNFDEGCTQQDIPSTTQRYILRSSINMNMNTNTNNFILDK